MNSILGKIKRKINQDPTEYEPKRFDNTIANINRLSEQLRTLPTTDLQAQATSLRTRYAQENATFPETHAQILSLVKEIIRRELGLIAFDVQLVAALAMLDGNIAQMNTGEGKTLVATLVAATKAMLGQHIHILTANDYLADRDMQWMTPVYAQLSVSTATVVQNMTTPQRHEAYRCNIVFSTAKEVGFDLLRDGMSLSEHDKVIDTFDFALVDEADCILLDQAKDPLIIAQKITSKEDDIQEVLRTISQFELGKEIALTKNSKEVYLTELGETNIESKFNCGNLYDKCNYELLCRVNDSLQAMFIYSRGKEYIVKSGKIYLIDSSTGRVIEDQRLPDGIQAAIEAKEGLKVQHNGELKNALTIVHLMREYSDFCGMTATAVDSYQELLGLYGKAISVIPPNKPCIRQDMPDRLFYTSDERDACVVQEVAAAHNCGQPVLIGSQSVEDSWRLSKLLEAESIPHQVLNAENDAKESEIIQLAGTLGAVTISTNMAGRGTDIKLGNGDTAQYDKIVALGGLYVIGTQRHDSKRIDLQLKGRAGRQGEPGISRFFISCDDLLIKRFSSFDMSIFERTEQGEINTALALKQLDKIQRVAEGHNLDVKTRLYKYEEVIYLQKRVFNVYRENLAHSDLQPLLEHFEETCPKHNQTLKEILPPDQVATFIQKLLLSRLDELWTDYFCESREVVQGIQYRILGGENPIMEYKKWALTTFEQVIEEFESGLASWLDTQNLPEVIAKMRNTNENDRESTWTYQGSNTLFDELHDALLSSAGTSLSAASQGGVFLILYLLVRKWSVARENRQAS